MTEIEKTSELDTDFEKPQAKMSRGRVALSRLKRRLLRHVWLVRLLILVGIVAGMIFLVWSFAGVFKNSSVAFYSDLARNFLLTPEENIKSLEGRTNILVLGKGGLGHEAPDLTDTIMLLSIDHNDPNITLISLPRDIWLTDLKTKLNSVYYWGNKRQVGGGMILAKATIEQVTGQPVNYAAVLDFSGFKKIIDALGGIEVDVETPFTDNNYPIAGRENDLCGGDKEFRCRYESIHFDKGVQKMDGETALKFVRSRQAEGDEGTDFARAARQQLVIEGIKQKLMSKEVLLSRKTLLSLKDVINESLETDLTPEAEAIVARRVFQTKFSPETHVLPEDLLENPPKLPKYDNLYVFIPKGSSTLPSAKEDWSKIHEWVKCILENRSCTN